jgi:hypothetical protein
MNTATKRAHRDAGLCWECSAPASVGRRCERHATARLAYESTDRLPVRAAYNASERGSFVRSTYEQSMRRWGLKAVIRERADINKLNDLYRLIGVDGQPVDLEPITPQFMDAVNERRQVLLNIERCGGWDLYRVRLNSGL